MKHLFFFIPIVMLSFSPLLLAQNQTDIQVEEIIICTSIENRQPMGADSVFPAEIGRLYCFTKLTSLTGMYSISHVWFYEDRQMAKVDLAVRAETWRTWSSKKILAQWKGNWRVEIWDASGNVVSEISFTID
jgi:hypothetical protein